MHSPLLLHSSCRWIWRWESNEAVAQTKCIAQFISNTWLHAFTAFGPQTQLQRPTQRPTKEDKDDEGTKSPRSHF